MDEKLTFENTLGQTTVSMSCGTCKNEYPVKMIDLYSKIEFKVNCPSCNEQQQVIPIVPDIKSDIDSFFIINSSLHTSQKDTICELIKAFRHFMKEEQVLQLRERFGI